MNQQAVLFADVSGSSRLYKTRGDSEAKQIISAMVDEMIRQAQQVGGVLVKTIGDEIMARFPSAQQAALAAQNIQRHLTGHPISHGLTLRIGFHYGPVLEEQGDIFGEAVNDAAALVKVARGEQIITSQATVDALEPWLQHDAQPFDRIVLKGGRAEELIYLLNWQEQVNPDATMLAQATVAVIPVPRRQRLQLQGMGHEALLEAQEGGTVVIGRDPAQCALSVPAPHASRQHCTVEYRRGKFVLRDHSTNGTYVQLGSGEPIYLRREEVALIGQGQLSLGSPLRETGALIVTFSVQE